MAVPSSGSLNMSKLAKEKLYDDYNSSSSVTGPIFMSDLVTGGNSSGSGESYDVTNINSASYPDNATPHAFSEWYGYDHDATAFLPEGFYNAITIEYPILHSRINPVNPYEIIYVGDLIPSTSTFVFTDEQSRWRAIYLDLDALGFSSNQLLRPVVMFRQSNVDFRNDVAVSGTWVWLDSNKELITGADYFDINPNNPTGSYTPVQRNVTQVSSDDPSLITTWQDIPYTFNPINNKWCIDDSETPSNGTGPQEDAWFVDTLDGLSGYNAWAAQADAQPYGNPYKYIYYESSGTYSVPSRQFMRFKEIRQRPTGAKYLSFAYSAWSEDGVNDWIDDSLKVWLEIEYITPPPTFG